MTSPTTSRASAGLALPLLLGAALLAGCASGDRLARISPIAQEKSPTAPDSGRTPLSDDRVNLFPFYYGAAGTNAILWPLIDWDDRGFAFRPLYNREDANASVLWPASGWDDSGGWALNSVWSKRGFLFLPVAGKWDGVTFVGPAFSDGDRHYGFAPLFGRYGDTWHALNVFVTEHSGETSTVAAYPFYYDDGKTLRISELYVRTREEDVVTSRSLLGIAYHREEKTDGSKGSLWALPGVYAAHDGENRLSVSLLHSEGVERNDSWFNIHPLWWSSTHGDTTRSLLIPFRWRRESPTVSATVTPLWSAGHDPKGDWLNIHPLWWSHREATSHGETLLPFYSRSESATGSELFAFPYYASHKDDVSKRVVFPLWWSSETQTGSSELLAPFWKRDRNGDDMSESTILWSRGNEGSEKWLNIHPLWWSSENADGFSEALVPLFYRRGDKDGHATFMPFYASGKERDREWFNIPPVWWSSSDGNTSSRTLAPLWRSYAGKNESGQYSWLWSLGEDARGSWFNIHPFWWSSRSGESHSELMLPLWWNTGDAGSDRTITPLWSYGHDKESSWFNIHPFWWSHSLGDQVATTCVPPLWYRRSAPSGSTVFTPLGMWSTDRTGEADSVNVLGIAWHWSDDGAGGVYRHALWPLFGTHRDAVGKGESIVTPTLIASESSDGYSGFRFTPILSVQNETSDVKMTRYVPHLVDWRRHGGDTDWYAFPLAYGSSRESGRGALRITPFYASSTEKTQPSWWEWAHLWRSASDGDVSRWSCVAISGGRTDAAGSETHVYPFYNHAEKGGKTVELHAWPFVSVSDKTGLWGSLCAWSHTTNPDKETRAVFGALWRRTDERDNTPADENDGPRTICRSITTTPFTENVAYVKTTETTTDDGEPVTVTGSGFTINPLWIPLYTEKEEGDASSWSVFFGLAGGEHRDGKGRDSVLRYLYDRQESEDGVRMNCFPFVQSDKLKDREKFSFLWRVFDRETDLRTGETKSHLMFIPF